MSIYGTATLGTRTRHQISARPDISHRLTCQNTTATHEQTPREIQRAMNHIFRRELIGQSDRKTVIEISHAVSRAVFEIIAGYRSVSQLAFVVDPECVNKLRAQALLETCGYTSQPEPGTSHGKVQSLHLCRTISGAYESAVVVVFKYRVRAVALRIEPWHGRWQVTNIEML